MVDIQPRSHDSGEVAPPTEWGDRLHTSVIMPISDRRQWWECSKGDLFIITPVCACYSGPCVLEEGKGPHGSTWFHMGPRGYGENREHGTKHPSGVTCLRSSVVIEFAY